MGGAETPRGLEVPAATAHQAPTFSLASVMVSRRQGPDSCPHSANRLVISPSNVLTASVRNEAARVAKLLHSRGSVQKTKLNLAVNQNR
jgi:hypothetical protein